MTLDRHSLRLKRLGPTSFCWLFWLWLQHWPTALVAATAAGVGAVLLTSISRLGSKQDLLRALVAAVTIANLAGFYVGFDATEPLHQRLSELPAGHALLSVSVLWALGDSLFSLERTFVKWTIRYARSVVYGISLVMVVLITVDSYFVGEGQPFKYPSYPPPQPARVFPANEGYVHASERFMVDLRDRRFAQRKPDGTTRIVLNGASTMWGYRLGSEDSPDGVLGRLLADRFPDRHFEVVNLAWPGKYQMNELVDAAVTEPHWHPDLVLSFNGFNEIWYSEDSAKFEGLPFWQEWQSAALSVPPLEALFFQHTQYGASTWRSQILRSKDDRIGLRQPALYEPPRYYDYLYATARTLADHGIRYVHAFCPNAIEMDATETKTLSRAAGDLAFGGSFAGLFTEARQRRRLSKRVVERAMQQSYDVMAPLAGMSAEDAFMDSCHLSRRGVKAVMADVAAHVTEWLEAPLLPMNAPVSPAKLAPLRLRAKPGAPFFTVVAGRRMDDDVMTSGSVGLVEASPRLELPAGHYRARWYGKVSAPGGVRGDIIGSENGASREYGQSRARVSPADDEQLLVTVDAELTKAVPDVQYRFFVDSQAAQMVLDEVVFEQVWDE